MKIIDLTGKTFGELTVIKRHGTHIRPSGKKVVTWLCKCSCGKEKVVVGYALKNGSTKSCGCKQFIHAPNEIKEQPDGLHIFVGNMRVIIDKEDYIKIYPRRVCIGNHGYACVGQHDLLHRIIIDCPKGYVIDHINHNKLDNRKSNLRVVTQSENMANRVPRSNTGEIGISLTKRGYYMVCVDHKYVGNAKSLEDAIELRNKALPNSRARKYNYYLSKSWL